MAKKSFIEDLTDDNLTAAELLITEPQTPQQKPVIEKHRKDTEKTETKSKRLNLLIQPGLYSDISKIATMQQKSVNSLITDILDAYRNNNTATIAKYNKTFR